MSSFALSSREPRWSVEHERLQENSSFHVGTNLYSNRFMVLLGAMVNASMAFFNSARVETRRSPMRLHAGILAPALTYT